MATYTSHYNLTKPEGTERVNIGIINQNMDSIDAQMYKNAQSIIANHGGMAIPSNNNTHAAVSSGQYVYVYNHSSLAEGMYVAKSAISTNGALSLSNLTAVSGGGLNHVYSTLNSKLETGSDFYFTLNSSQTSQFEINKMRAKTFGDIYIFCLVLNPLVDIGTGEIQLGEVSRAPGLNTATVVTRNSDTKPIGGANLLENRKLYMRLTESVNQGNLLYISLATTDA